MFLQYHLLGSILGSIHLCYVWKVYQMKIRQWLGYHLKCFDKMYNLLWGIWYNVWSRDMWMTSIGTIWLSYSWMVLKECRIKIDHYQFFNWLDKRFNLQGSCFKVHIEVWHTLVDDLALTHQSQRNLDHFASFILTRKIYPYF